LGAPAPPPPPPPPPPPWGLQALLYKVFVANSSRLTVQELATVLDVQVEQVGRGGSLATVLDVAGGAGGWRGGWGDVQQSAGGGGGRMASAG
jgi:hypothetical protein